MDYNPALYSEREVLTYLLAIADDAERGRVLAMERTGLGRHLILSVFTPEEGGR